MRFQPGISGNPAGRPKGSVNKSLSMIRQAADTILPQVLAQAMGGHFESQKLILQLGIPKLKPVEAPVEFDLPEAGESTPARAVLQQAAAGELSLSQAEKLVYDLLPLVQQEQKALDAQTKKAFPPGTVNNTYLHALLQQSG